MKQEIRLYAGNERDTGMLRFYTLREINDWVDEALRLTTDPDTLIHTGNALYVVLPSDDYDD